MHSRFRSSAACAVCLPGRRSVGGFLLREATAFVASVRRTISTGKSSRLNSCSLGVVASLPSKRGPPFPPWQAPPHVTAPLRTVDCAGEWASKGEAPVTIQGTIPTADGKFCESQPLFWRRAPNPWVCSHYGASPRVSERQLRPDVGAALEAIRELGASQIKSIKAHPSEVSPPGGVQRIAVLRELNVLLTRALTKAPSAHVLFSRLWRFSAFITPANAAAALHRLAVLLQQQQQRGLKAQGGFRFPGASAGILDNPVLQLQLQRLVRRGLRKMSPRHLGMAAWALAFLCRLHLSVTRTSTSSLRQGHNVLLQQHREHTLNLFDAPSLLLGALLEAALPQAENLAPIGCGSTAWACAVLNELAHTQQHQGLLYQQQQQLWQQQQQQRQQQEQLYSLMCLLRRRLVKALDEPFRLAAQGLPLGSAERGGGPHEDGERMQQTEVNGRVICTVLWASARVTDWGLPEGPQWALDESTLSLLAAVYKGVRHKESPSPNQNETPGKRLLSPSNITLGGLMPVDAVMLSETLLCLFRRPRFLPAIPDGPDKGESSRSNLKAGHLPCCDWGLLTGFLSLALQQLPACDLRIAAQLVGASRLLHELFVVLESETAPKVAGGQSTEAHRDDMDGGLRRECRGSRSEAEALLNSFYGHVDQRVAAAATALRETAAAPIPAVAPTEAHKAEDESLSVLDGLVACAAQLAAATALTPSAIAAIGEALLSSCAALLDGPPHLLEGRGPLRGGDCFEYRRVPLVLGLCSFLAGLADLSAAATHQPQIQKENYQQHLVVACAKALSQLLRAPPPLPMQATYSSQPDRNSLPPAAQRQLLRALERTGVSMPRILQRIDAATAALLGPSMLKPQPWAPIPQTVMRGAPERLLAEHSEGWRSLVFGICVFSRLGEPCPQMVALALAALQQQQQLECREGFSSLGPSASARLAWGLALQLPVACPPGGALNTSVSSYSWGPLLTGISVLLQGLPAELPLLEAAQARQGALALEAAAAALRPHAALHEVGDFRGQRAPAAGGKGEIPSGASIWSEGFLHAFLCDSLKPLRSKLMRWEDTLKREAPASMKGPRGPPRGSALQREVMGVLAGLCASGALQEFLLEEQCFGGSRFLSADGGSPATRLLLEVDGPSHFITIIEEEGASPLLSQEVGAPDAATTVASKHAEVKCGIKERLDGSSTFKSFALQLLGWRLVRLSYREWEDAPDKAALLSALLSSPADIPLQKANNNRPPL